MAMKNAKPMKAMKAMKAKAMKATRAKQMGCHLEVMHTEIIEISYETKWDNMWWALPADKSADLMRQFRSIGSGPKVVRFDWEWPAGKHGTKRGLDGEATNSSSYILDFDHLMQRNMDTHFKRKFRVIRECTPPKQGGSRIV
jgi:hypothetical protein